MPLTYDCHFSTTVRDFQVILKVKSIKIFKLSQLLIVEKSSSFWSLSFNCFWWNKINSDLTIFFRNPKKIVVYKNLYKIILIEILSIINFTMMKSSIVTATCNIIFHLSITTATDVWQHFNVEDSAFNDVNYREFPTVSITLCLLHRSADDTVVCHRNNVCRLAYAVIATEGTSDWLCYISKTSNPSFFQI